jgi:hypothetical protein
MPPVAQKDLGDRLGLRLLRHPAGAAAVVGAAFAGLAVRAAVRPIDDPDVWWVAAAGRRVLATGRAPAENLFSYAEPTRPWIMHEWLFAVPYALGLERLGPSFFALAALLVLAAGAALVVRATAGACRRPAAGAALALLALGAFGARLLSARPAGAALLFPACMIGLAFGPRLTWAAAIAAVGVEVVWANAHGSFPLGVALLGAAALEGREDRQRRVIAALAAAAVTLVNPYGIRLHGLVLGYLAGDGGGTYDFIRETLTEFAPLWRDRGRVAGGLELFGLAVVAGLAASAMRVPARRPRALICFGLLALAVMHVRHVEHCGLLGCMLLAPQVDDLLDRLGAPAPDASPRPGWAYAALVPGALIALLAHVEVRGKRDFAGWIAPSLGGPAVVALAGAIPDGARVFAPFKTSSLLIWLGAERGVRVLRDPRNDCYSREVLEIALALDTPIPSAAAARARLDGAGADHLLLGPGAPLRVWVEQDPQWQLAGEAGGHALYARR